MGNRYDQFYGLTGLFPVLDNPRVPVSHATALRATLAALDNGPGSLFSRTGLVHAGRLFLIDDLVYNGAPQREEHLPWAHLAFSLTFDGELERLAGKLAAVGQPELDRIFVHCFGYRPGPDAETLLAFLRTGQVTTSFLYVDASELDLEATLRALQVQREVADMVLRGQSLPVAERKRLVAETAKRLRVSRRPVPGGFADDA
jgi:hypothetical protein